MNKQQLASLIWDTCNDMRGSISAVEYKDIILGFIFYRFVSENEVSYLKKQDWTMEIMAEELTEEDSETVKQCKDHLGYFIAYKDLFSTWKDHTAKFTVSNVTDALNAFVRNIGSNPDHQKLYNEIFKSLSEKLSKMGSISNQTSHIKNIIKIVSRIPMDENQGYDVLGFIYEFLLKNFASNSKKDGEFYTPHEISILMSEIIAHHLRDREQINILDPTSGSGSLLINIGQSVQKHLQDSGNITYYAQELIQETFNLTRMNLVMRGINPSNIKVRRGDTLANDWPYFDDNDKEKSYRYVPVDCVVSNPPYSHKWDADKYINDPRYKEYGIAPASKADYAFLLHDLYHLKDNGIMCIVMPHGVLFRGGSEKDIRKQLIENNNIESIIGLPSNCFYGTGISTIIMVLKKHREASDILIVDASKEFFKDGNKNRLSGHHIKKIVDAVLNRENIPHFASLVSKQTIITDNDYNLNIPRYIESEEKVPVDLHATVFGGIPNYEVEHLKKYWEAFPSLCNELFTRINEHTSELSCDSVIDAIRHNADVVTFEANYKEAFQALEAQLYELLIDNQVENVAAMKTEITKRIFDLCQQFAVVDKYLVYKAFDDIWEQISLDLEMIRLQGFDAARSVEDIEVYDKKEKKAVKKGEEGRVIPFSLIQKHLFADEFTQMDSLNKKLSGATSEYEAFWEELDEELKEELKKKEEGDEQSEAKLDTKLLKAKYQEVLTTLCDDTTKKYAEYAALKPKQKVEFQQSHPELIWPDETEKAKNGTYKQAAMNAIVEQIKNSIEIDEEENDYKIRYLYFLGQQISALKKQIKELKIDLDNKAREAIVTLSDDEIKILLKEKWLTPAMQSINAIPNAIISDLNRSVNGIITKYENPIFALDTDISKTEESLSVMLNDLTGDAFDIAAIKQFKTLLGGKENE